MEDIKFSRFILVTKWNDHHYWPKPRGLHNLIFNAKKNGFDSVVHRKAGRVFINEDAFFEWLGDGYLESDDEGKENE